MLSVQSVSLYFDNFAKCAYMYKRTDLLGSIIVESNRSQA